MVCTGRRKVTVRSAKLISSKIEMEFYIYLKLMLLYLIPAKCSCPVANILYSNIWDADLTRQHP